MAAEISDRIETTVESVVASCLPLKKRRDTRILDLECEPAEERMNADVSILEESAEIGTPAKEVAFVKYVQGIFSSIKHQEAGAQKLNEEEIVTSTTADSTKFPTKQPVAPILTSSRKRFSAFTIDAILGIGSEKEATETDSKQPTISSTSPVSLPLSLKYMQVLSAIRQKQLKLGESLQKMTECGLCGGCSFSQSKAVAANYMTQHLYTHLPLAIYSCSLCDQYCSSWKPRVLNHIKNGHPCVAEKDAWRFIFDHRPELDTSLSALAIRCYGTY